MPDRPRVLQMGPDPAIGGGMAAALRALLESPLADRYRLDVVSTYRDARPLPRLLVYLRALLRLAGWALLGRGRLVHVHATVRGSMYRKSVCVLLAKALRRRVVLHVHSGAGDIAAFRAGLGTLSLALFQAAFRAADAVLAVSVRSAAALVDAYGIAAPEAVPNAAPPVRRVERSEPREGRLEVAYLGGFANPAKGGDVLLAALELALPRTPGMVVQMAGPGELPRPGTDLVARYASLSWLGWLEMLDRDRLLAASRVLVLPSRSEGSPMALLEAMSFGLAVVAADVGGIPEVVADGEEAILVEPENPAALAGALCELAGDPARAVRLGEAARKRAEKLDAVEVAGRLGSLYARLL